MRRAVLCSDEPKVTTHSDTPPTNHSALAGLLLAEESLAELLTRSGCDASVRNFRPNVMVSGGGAWAEDEWGRIKIGGSQVTKVTPPSNGAAAGAPPARGAKYVIDVAAESAAERGMTFAMPKPCARCVVPTVNPTTAAYDRRFEPIKTLRTCVLKLLFSCYTFLAFGFFL
jgi:uncharacterized protein YcbX